MGQQISDILATDAKEEVKESVQILQKLLSAKVEASAKGMEASAYEDKSLPIIAVVAKTESCTVNVSKDSVKSVGKVVGSLFKGDFLDGLHNLVSTALDELLGNASAGEKEKRERHVIYANNSILRVDYFMYKYDFRSTGLKNTAKNAFCYVVQVAVLDLKKVDPQIALYELDRAVGEGSIQAATKKLHEEANFMEDLFNVLSRLEKAAPSSLTDMNNDNEHCERREKQQQQQQQSNESDMSDEDISKNNITG